MHPRARAQRLEVAIGLLGFFYAVALISVVVAFARGSAMLAPMMVLVGFTALLAVVVRLRQRMRL